MRSSDTPGEVDDQRATPRYRLLSDAQIERLHQASLEVLATVGIRVQHAEARSMLHAAGCPREADDIFLIPSPLVEACIESAPSAITLHDREGHEAMHLEGFNSYFGPGTDLLRTFDVETGELRPSCLQDVVNAARVVDFCPEVDFCASFALPQDVPTNTMYVESFRAQVENTSKPIFFTAAGKEDLGIIFRIAAAVAGGEDELRRRPFMIHYAETRSPLTHSQSGVDKLFLCADRGLPVNYTQGMMMGASGPVTLAGAIAVANAEALSGIVLHQLRARGAPICSGLAVVPLDMRSMIFSYGAPEYRLTDAAYADLYHHYRLPMWGTAGCSDANSLDEQASAEAAISILMSIQSGANLIHDIGYLGQGLIGNPAAIVMCNELIGYARRVQRGFDLGSETIPMDLIRQVGPTGSYLGEAHTVQHHRREFWRPELSNRDTPGVWLKKGGKEFGEALTERTRLILATHRPSPLPGDLVTRIDEIAREAEVLLRDTQFAV